MYIGVVKDIQFNPLAHEFNMKIHMSFLRGFHGDALESAQSRDFGLDNR
jgi:hypothetical protein